MGRSVSHVIEGFQNHWCRYHCRRQHATLTRNVRCFDLFVFVWLPIHDLRGVCVVKRGGLTLSVVTVLNVVILISPSHQIIINHTGDRVLIATTIVNSKSRSRTLKCLISKNEKYNKHIFIAKLASESSLREKMSYLFRWNQ